jgi:hypothetical protein
MLLYIQLHGGPCPRAQRTRAFRFALRDPGSSSLTTPNTHPQRTLVSALFLAHRSNCPRPCHHFQNPSSTAVSHTPPARMSSRAPPFALHLAFFTAVVVYVPQSRTKFTAPRLWQICMTRPSSAPRQVAQEAPGPAKMATSGSSCRTIVMQLAAFYKLERQVASPVQ